MIYSNSNITPKQNSVIESIHLFSEKVVSEDTYLKIIKSSFLETNFLQNVINFLEGEKSNFNTITVSYKGDNNKGLYFDPIDPLLSKQQSFEQFWNNYIEYIKTEFNFINEEFIKKDILNIYQKILI